MIAVSFSAYGPPDVLELAEVAEPHAGPGQVRIAVRAAGVNIGDCNLRAGRLKEFVPLTLPHVTGIDAAGIVDEIGAGVTDVRPGDAVFGWTDVSRLGGAVAGYAVLTAWAAKPAELSWEEAGGAAANVETATRALDRLGVGPGTTLLVEGAAGGVGTVAVQLARARGATVVGTARTVNHDFLQGLGAVPVTYGEGLAERVAVPVDAVLDCAGSGSLPDLVAIAGGPERVVTIADARAEAYGVEFSRIAGPRANAEPALYGLAVAADLAREGRFAIPLAGAYPLAEAAEAHRLSESGHARGKVVLRVGA
ncbi:NADP-dependent oxidoreductase [Actinomadura sp. DC4]|uniref:NADP-dependent oxidoreductase n=1 Tax=Actinomadura sp. DC4 TaxID=3055069 RepID=UPI0025AEFE11|nr:NADP-dependent oxidoreductase [Actinomadura sp. DC4]MDN3353426.1 NADP-dependent oxidoreductase [Actinomadura sp. DC4]